MASMTRFNLLLLEEGEQYFEDYAAILYLPNNNKPVSSRKQLSGRLKVASKNLIFEPHSMSYPIIRFPYLSMESLRMDKSKQHLIVVTSHIVKLKTYGVVSPYLFEDISQPNINGVYVFEPSYSRLDDFVGLVAKIYQITKTKNSTTISIRERVNKLMNLRENKIAFDSSWFVDIDEISLLNEPLIVSKLTPLVSLRGQIQVTKKRIYFQPFHNQSSNPMLKYNLKDVKYIYKRRHIMLNTALELIINEARLNSRDNYDHRILSSGRNTNTLLLSFNDSSTRDYIYKLLLSQNSINIKQSLSQNFVQKQWLNGNISNFDYLMFLNQHSGRSFNDLTQYPIFPWIITDYESQNIDLNNNHIYRDLSSPVGALNPKRLQKVLLRYHEMASDNKFHYGSHYSSPAYVMYFLVRQYPEYMLRFQNGKFDAPDRLFSSIKRTWDSAYSSLTDVKELIPQFYDGDGSFLLNTNNLNLGIRSDKKEVHHVELPKWANNNPKYFVETLRKALESDYVSQQLHHWIDLIFGYKQCGDEAEKAFNKFYYLTYEGAVDVESIKDKEELNSIQMQINEFGQTPSQLFTAPHPVKSVDHYEHKKQQLSIATLPNWQCLENNSHYICSTVSPHSHRITDLCVSSDSKYLFSTSHDSTLSVYCFSTQQIVRSTKVSHLALSSCCTPFDFGVIPFCMIGSWDNNIYIYNNNTNKIQQTLSSHNDAVSCLDSWQSGVNSGSWDNTIKIWQYKGNDGMVNKPIITYKIECEVRCISNSCLEPNILINGDENGNIYMWDTRIGANNKYITLWSKAHKDEITSICWVPNKFEFISIGNCYMKHWNGTPNGKLIKQISTRENLNDIKTDGNLVITAGESGDVRLFKMDQFNEISTYSLKSTNAHSISKLCLTQNGKYIVIGTKQYTSNVHIFESQQHQLHHHNKSYSNSSPIINYKNKQNKNVKTYSFGSSAFAKLTQSASNLFSFGSNDQK